MLSAAVEPTCAYDGEPLQGGDAAVVCDRCRRPAHGACLERQRRCATQGCKGRPVPTPVVERVVLSREGTVWAWTAVTAAPPGYEGEVPYGFGIVELTKERLRIVTRLRESDPDRLSFSYTGGLSAEPPGKSRPPRSLPPDIASSRTTVSRSTITGSTTMR